MRKVEKIGQAIFVLLRRSQSMGKKCFIGGNHMNKTVSSVLKGAAAGAVMGTAAYLVMGGKPNVRQMKKKASKAMKTMGHLFDSISYMM